MVFKFQSGGLSVIGKNAGTEIKYTPVFPESMARQPKDIGIELPKVEDTEGRVEAPFIVPKTELPEIPTDNNEDSGGKGNQEDDTITSGSWDENVKSMGYGLKKNTNFNNVQISGLLACLSNESSLNPTAVNQGEMRKGNGDYRAGRGIAQWSLDRNLAYSRWHNETYGSTGSHYADQDDLATQLAFIIYEMQQRPAFMEAFSKATTPKQAADAVRRGYENGSASALATTQQMNRYTRVGSPSASGFYTKDSQMADKIYKMIEKGNH